MEVVPLPAFGDAMAVVEVRARGRFLSRGKTVAALLVRL
jgi:hypothetical protein